MDVAYSFYLGEYHGNKISENDWPRLSTRATSYLDSVSVSILDTDTAYKMAVCAVAEAVQDEEQGGPLQSQTVGGWSKTYATDGRAKDKLFAAASLYLPGKVSKVRWA